MNSTYSKIFEFIKKLEIIDTHEHLPHKEEAREQDTDVLKDYLQHYFSSDLISSGLSKKEYQQVMGGELSLSEKWELVEPYWNYCRNTGYGRALDISVRELYGLKEISGDTIEELNHKYQQTFGNNHFHQVLKEKSNIKISLLDSNLDCDRNFFRSVIRLDQFILPENGEEIRDIEEKTGITISSFENWLQACEKYLDQVLAEGAVALKSGLAYRRSLNYERASRDSAQKEFQKLLKGKINTNWEAALVTPGKEFQDYMMHYILGLAQKRELTYQIHTGLQEGNGNLIKNSDPLLLNNLFLQYPGVDFDIFHIGYPFQQSLAAAAKNFPNVFIDMCWAHIISPQASVQILSEYLDSVPANKISAFGGDYCFVDGVYGHQYLARINVSKVLAEKVENGIMDLERAKKIARMLFYENPVQIFNLEV